MRQKKQTDSSKKTIGRKNNFIEKENFNWLLHEVNKVLTKCEKKHAHDNEFIRRLSETLWKEALI